MSLEDENQKPDGQQPKKNKKKVLGKARKKKADDASMAFFLQAALYTFFVTLLTFLLFLNENRYPLIIDNNVLPEILFVCGGIFALSVLTTLIFSLNRYVLYIFLSFLTGSAVAYILGLILPYNFGEFLLLHLPLDFAKRFLLANGNLTVGILAGIITFVLLYFYKSVVVGFATLPALAIIIYLLNLSASRALPEISVAKPALTADEQNGVIKDKNIVYLILADHIGYDYALKKWSKDVPEKRDEALVPFFIGDFYKENKFDFYPRAYVRYSARYLNVGNLLNPKLTEITNDMFGYSDASYYKGDEDTFVALLKNDLFKSFKDKGYTVTAYQTYPVDFCKGVDGAVDKCVSYPAPLGFLYNSPLSTLSKVFLLAGHWINSAPMAKSALNFIRDELILRRMVSADMPFLGNPLSKALPVGQQEVLTRLKNDVLKAKGQNVFFAHVMLPDYPYMYDSACRLNIFPEKWTLSAPVASAAVLDGKGEKNRWKQYNQQAACLYGQLNAMIQDFKKAGLLKNTTIVIAGDKGADISEDAAALRHISTFDKNMNFLKKNLSTIFAVYDPDIKKQTLSPTGCDVGTLAAHYLTGDKSLVCSEPELKPFKLADNEKHEILTFLSLTDKDARYDAPSQFKKWYADWLENGGKTFLEEQENAYRKKEIQEANKKGSVKFIAPPEIGKLEELKKQKNKKQNDLNVPVPDADIDAILNAAAQDGTPEAEAEVKTETETETKAESKEETSADDKAISSETVTDAATKQEEKKPDAEKTTAQEEKPTETVAEEKEIVSKTVEQAEKTPEQPSVTKEEKVEETVKPSEKTDVINVPDVSDMIDAADVSDVVFSKQAPQATVEDADEKDDDDDIDALVVITPAVVKNVPVKEAKPSVQKKAEKPKVSVKKSAAKKPSEKKAKKSAKKTTAQSGLPPTTAPDVWKLDEKEKQPSEKEADTTAQISDLDDLEKMFLEIDTDSPVEKTEENAAVAAGSDLKKENTDVQTATVLPAEKQTDKVVETVVPSEKTTVSDEDIAKAAALAAAVKPVPEAKAKIEKPTTAEQKTVTDVSKEVQKTESVTQTAKTAKTAKIEKTAKAEKTTKKTPAKPQKSVAKPKVVKPADVKAVAKKNAEKQAANEETLLERVSAEKELDGNVIEKRRPAVSKENVDVTREFVSKKMNAYGQEETFILIERTTVPNKVVPPAELDRLIEKAR